MESFRRLHWRSQGRKDVGEEQVDTGGNVRNYALDGAAIEEGPIGGVHYGTGVIREATHTGDRDQGNVLLTAVSFASDARCSGTEDGVAGSTSVRYRECGSCRALGRG